MLFSPATALVQEKAIVKSLYNHYIILILVETTNVSTPCVGFTLHGDHLYFGMWIVFCLCVFYFILLTYSRQVGSLIA